MRSGSFRITTGSSGHLSASEYAPSDFPFEYLRLLVLEVYLYALLVSRLIFQAASHKIGRPSYLDPYPPRIALAQRPTRGRAPAVAIFFPGREREIFPAFPSATVKPFKMVVFNMCFVCASRKPW